jgi:hypothetical protein
MIFFSTLAARFARFAVLEQARRPMTRDEAERAAKQFPDTETGEGADA